jgi:hypothetical protein
MTPQSPSNCRIWWDASIQAYRLTSPFNKDLVEAFKTLVPASDRAFDPQTKIWTFTERWLSPTSTLIETLMRAKPQVVTRAQAEQASQGSPAGPQRQLPLDTVIVQFVKLMPFEACQKAYRQAALLMHPDRGGDMAKMQSLNTAWDRIQKELYGQ